MVPVVPLGLVCGLGPQVRNDKYRPETCCIIGNYYSLKVCTFVRMAQGRSLRRQRNSAVAGGRAAARWPAVSTARYQIKRRATLAAL